MSEIGEDSAPPTWFDDNWRPRSLRPARRGWLSYRGRTVVLVAVMLLHVFAGQLLYRYATRPEGAGPGSMRVQFVFEFPPIPAPPPEAKTRAAVAPTSAPATQAPKVHARESQPASSTSLPARPVASRPVTSSGLDALSMRQRLYDVDGRVRVSKQLLDDLEKRYGDSRSFSYQVPRLGDAEKVWGRKQALVYEPTRFAEYWKPDQDLLTALLTDLVEKTTKEIRMPVPGRPQSTMVCKISLLALGGGCGILTGGSDYLGPQDDPDTLNDEEDRQCQAWWNQIAGAATQDVWRRTRKLYDAQCRKPRERKPSG